ncbi:MAG TPA: S-layer homology domain-containing protein, partial [Acidimicrobiales bacterium]|nr:S-layer homology domain-containing protein [Acidimicrobiales bacterium]
TNSSGPDSTDPSISDDGTRIAFRSEADLTGENADGNGEIFLHDTDTDTTTQLTATTGGENLQPVITDDGTKVAFVSTVDLTDDAPDGGADLFVLDTDDHSVTRLADADAVGLESAAFDGSGTRFVSYGTVDLTGDNPDLSYEVFLHHLGTGTTTQLTDLPDDSVNLNRPDLAEAGNRVAFETDADLIGENADARHELFVVDRTGQVGPDQLSESPAGNGVSDPSVNADGSRIALAWTGDPSGGNADGGREIFVFTCGAPGPSFVDVSPGSFFYEQIEWMSGAGIASGFPGGRYKPTEAVRRQQMANFLHNLAGQPGFSPPPSPTFVDVPTSNPFFLQIEWMANEGIASGFPGGRFKPLGPVKRQQMANFLHNLAGQPAFTPPATPTFVDVPTTNPFYLQVEWMAAESIASGFSGGRFEPLDPVKRQQMANFLINLLNGPGIDLN